MKKFDIPSKYRSSIISKIKEHRKLGDPRKKDFSPTVLDFGPLNIYVARHFGFCYGVENAIEIAYKIIDENPNKRIFLLSEMIHNPSVNDDLQKRGITFVMDTYGNQLISWDEINADDIVIIPAFGTTVEIENMLIKKGIDTIKYNTTCPFVERVWNRAETLGQENYTIIIHGKLKHEETRATFSHSILKSASLIIRNLEEAKILGDIILGKIPGQKLYEFFSGKYSENFDVKKDLQKIGVVNQTTMLASETQAIADYLKNIMIKKFGKEKLKEHFADTRDTLCYATNDNQSATIALLETNSDFALVVGGYNSSNTTHLVEILEQKFKTYFISDSEKIISNESIRHYDIHAKKEIITKNFINQKEKVNIAITSGASCPDSIVDEVIKKLISFFENAKSLEDVILTINN
ncbi:4-hydroxy-3-methylbut-2-enyl diphosphate reductase [Melioribacteraceae bacterium 4301-Me]|uniref:4-hydroxy-3-methylbut-2-enyl diphosphate reductase n=1 Tax=Pyranulibacter aquaticus TaxID=3163344 RepID=UPI003594E130